MVGMLRPGYQLLIFSVAAFGQTTAPLQTAVPLRLPVDVQPTHYQATLDVKPGDDSFGGHIEISLVLKKPTAEITLHAKEIQFKSVIPAASQIEKRENDLVTLHFAQPFQAGAAKLSIDYSGTISRILTDGAFQQEHAGEWYVFTKFEPITARRVFPCFDEPGFKVPWQLSLRVPKDLKAFSNTPIAGEEPAGDGLKLVRFRVTKPLPSYLVAFAVGPFDVVETAPVGRNIPSRIAVPKGRAAEAEYAASITPKLIEMLEGYFGTPYPYDKLDQVIVPLTTAWGAMENAAMIAYGDFLLAPKAQDSEIRHQQTALTMEHEMSHQWFGDLVTMQWWNDLWLNEAFASWISNKLVSGWHSEWGINERRAASIAIFRADSLTTARKIRQPIEAAGDIGTAFDGITYGKGQAVIAMFEHFATEPKFELAVREYLKAHSFGNATSDDFLAVLDTTSPGKGIGNAFRTFLNQVGFPEVGMALDCSSKPMVRLTQVRTVPKGSTAKEGALWNVPVCLSWDGRSQCVLLKTAAQSVSLGTKACPAYLFADAGAAGYYVTSYSTADSIKLRDAGLNHLSRVEKAAYARDARVLFASGLGDLEQELRTAAAFSRDEDPNLVQQSAYLIESTSDLVTEDLRSSYAQHIQELYGARAHQLGWCPKAGDTPEIRDLRSEVVQLVATEGGDSGLMSEARKLAGEWLQDHNALEAEIVPDVLATAAWNGDREFFEKLTAALGSTQTRRERAWIITGIAAFRNPAISQAGLDLIGAPGIDPRETARLLVASSMETRPTVWRYIQANYDKLNQMMPSARGVPFGATLPNAVSGFCDMAHADEVETYFKPRLEKTLGGRRNLNVAVERIRLCSAQSDVAKPAVRAFLRP